MFLYHDEKQEKQNKQKRMKKELIGLFVYVVVVSAAAADSIFNCLF